MSDHHSNRHIVSKNAHAGSRRRPSGTWTAERARDAARALREALAQLERAKLQTTQRTNPDDDDEDPTRRG